MYGAGGEFDAVWEAFPANPVKLTMDPDPPPVTFETFCLEAQVPVQFGVQYNAGFLASPNPAVNEPVAWLYDQFIRGVLAGYNYANAGGQPNRESDAGALQYAIWELLGQNTAGHPFNPNPAETVTWKTLATGAAPVGSGNFFGVQALEISTGSPPDFAQKLLVKLVPTPSTGALLALGGLVAVRRRRK